MLETHVKKIHDAALHCGCTGKLIVASYGQDPKTGETIKPKVQQFAVGDVDGMIQAVKTLSKEPHRNVYIPLSTMESKPDHPLKATAKGGEKNIEMVFGLVADFDDDDAKKYVERCPVTPSYVLETSAGRFQAFFFLDTGLTFEDAKPLGIALRDYALCDDGTSDMSHVWRVASTLNWPNKRKVEEGRSETPQTVTVVKAWDGSYTSVVGLREALKNELKILTSAKTKAEKTKIQKELKPNPAAQNSSILTDEEILNKLAASSGAEKTLKLLQCDDTDYGNDASKADAALIFKLAFYTKDQAQLDRMFRNSARMRAKWDEVHYAGGQTYGQKIINDALAQVTAQYNPNFLTTQKNPPRTDTGNGERLAAQHGEKVRYCYQWGKWFIWTGKAWKVDTTGEMKRTAKAVARSILKEAAKAKSTTKAKDIAKWAFKSESEAGKKAMIESAQSEPGIPVEPDQFDVDPWLFNVQNGTINLRTGALLPHKKTNLITKISPANYDPNATCPMWLDLLKLIFGNTHMMKFVRRAVGYSLTGDISEQCLFFLIGDGANGKSTFLEVVRSLLGTYAMNTDFTTFLQKSNDAIRNDLARLKGARFVTAVEMEKGKRLSEVTIKQITGGEPITARFFRKEFFEYRPPFKVWLASNHRPKIVGNDHAIWRRIKSIPCNKVIDERNQIKNYAQKIISTELPGILNWAVEGCLDWKCNGLGVPLEVKNFTDQYRNEMDSARKFISECCLLNPLARVPIGDLYEAYKGWAFPHVKPESKADFGKVIEKYAAEKKPTKIRGETVRAWHGIGLRDHKGGVDKLCQPAA